MVPVIDSARGKGTRSRRGTKILHTEGGGENKEHFKGRGMDFLLKSWSRDQNFNVNLRGGQKFHQICENVFYPLPTGN